MLGLRRDESGFPTGAPTVPPKAPPPERPATSSTTSRFSPAEIVEVPLDMDDTPTESDSDDSSPWSLVPFRPTTRKKKTSPEPTPADVMVVDHMRATGKSREAAVLDICSQLVDQEAKQFLSLLTPASQ